jgi:alcohol dehydrogenase (cytochrome c)
MKLKRWVIAGAVILAVAVAGGVFAVADPFLMTLLAATARNFFVSLSAPPGTIAIESNPSYAGPPAVAPSPAATPPGREAADWPTYNRTLTSDRYSPLSQLDTKNVSELRVLCTYDIDQWVTFESGLIMVENALIGTSQFDIFSIDPATCKENWRTHEDYPRAILQANRGAAYMNGRLFRGTQDGRVLAYDFKTGKRLWATTIADPNLGESVPSAPIASDGLVFVGNAGGDYKGGKGHMYALDAETGKIVWEFFLVPKTDGDVVRGPLGASPLDLSTWNNLPGMPISGGGTWTSYTFDPQTGLLYVPGGNPAPDYDDSVRPGGNLYTGAVVVLDAKTGAYKHHFKLVPKDWHDWDVSSAPVLIQTAGGKQLMSVAPKDGHLYGFDRATNNLLYRVPVTRIENVEARFSTERSTHFCPGATGGAEWNGPAYDPQTNLVLIGQVDWCYSVTLLGDEALRLTPMGVPWMGMWALNPFNLLGRPATPDKEWGGWVRAVNADTGVWAWRVKSNYPIVSGMTPTAGGVVFFGDMGGNFYAFDGANGQKLWGKNLGDAIGGGVITYTANGVQRVAVAAGMAGLPWPTKQGTGKIVILGLDSAAAKK